MRPDLARDLGLRDRRLRRRLCHPKDRIQEEEEEGMSEMKKIDIQSNLFISPFLLNSFNDLFFSPEIYPSTKNYEYNFMNFATSLFG